MPPRLAMTSITMGTRPEGKRLVAYILLLLQLTRHLCIKCFVFIRGFLRRSRVAAHLFSDVQCPS
jgi:hypothetical protein